MIEIDYFSKGELKINGEVFKSDVVLYPQKVPLKWRRGTNGSKVTIKDFQMAIPERPAYLVIGNGQDDLLQIDDFTQSQLRDLGFEVYIAKTRTAVNKYNKISNSKKTIGFFHLS